MAELKKPEEYAKMEASLKSIMPKVAKLLSEQKFDQAVDVLQGAINDSGIKVSTKTFKLKSDGSVNVESTKERMRKILVELRKKKTMSKEAYEKEKKEQEEKEKEESAKDEEGKPIPHFTVRISPDKLKELAQNKDKTATRSFLRAEIANQAAGQGVTYEQLTKPISTLNVKDFGGGSHPRVVGAGKGLIDAICDLYVSQIYGLDSEKVLSESQTETATREAMESSTNTTSQSVQRDSVEEKMKSLAGLEIDDLVNTIINQGEGMAEVDLKMYMDELTNRGESLTNLVPYDILESKGLAERVLMMGVHDAD